MRVPCILVLFICFSSCEPDKETDVYIYFDDVYTTDSLSFDGYQGEMSITYYVNGVQTNSVRDNFDGEYNSVPTEVVPLLGDSVAVVFNDTLRVIHRFISKNQEIPELKDRSNIIWYGEARNIYDANSYSSEKVSNGVFHLTYTFTEEDLEYSIKVNE
jgi:hypothetical protein